MKLKRLRQVSEQQTGLAVLYKQGEPDMYIPLFTEALYDEAIGAASSLNWNLRHVFQCALDMTFTLKEIKNIRKESPLREDVLDVIRTGFPGVETYGFNLRSTSNFCYR